MRELELFLAKLALATSMKITPLIEIYMPIKFGNFLEIVEFFGETGTIGHYMHRSVGQDPT